MGTWAWWASQPPNIKSAVKKLGTALLISLAIVALLYLWIWIKVSPDANVPSAPLAITAARMVAWVDSLFAGIVAFALLGAFTFVASIRRPHDEAIDLRIEYLYSSRSAGSKGSRDYLKSQVMLLGATVSRATMKYTILTVEGKQMLTGLSVSMTLVNQMSRDSYEQNMPLRIAFDKVNRPGGRIGKVQFVRTSPSMPGGGYGSAHEHLPHTKIITNADPIFETELSLHIPPSGSLFYEYLYEAWSQDVEAHKVGANRFIDELIIEIHNTTDHSIAIERDTECDRKRCRSVPPGGNKTLAKGESIEYRFSALPPTEDISFIQRLLI